MFSAIGLWFALGSALALVLAALRVPLSAPKPPLKTTPRIKYGAGSTPSLSEFIPSEAEGLGTGSWKGGDILGKEGIKERRLGRLIYVPYAVLLVAIVFFIRFEIRVARAAASAARGDFAAARALNPYYPEYALSWAEQEIDALAKADLTADVTASKQKVGEIVKGLEGLMSLRGAERRSNPRINAMNSGIASSSPFAPPRRGYGGLLAMTIRTARAWENLGKFAEGANERALAIYDALIAAQGEKPDSSLIIKKALLLEKSGKANQALSFLRKQSLPRTGYGESSFNASGLDAGSGSGMTSGMEIRYHLGRLLYNSGKEKEASDIWRAILKDEPDYSDVNYSLGAYFARQKNYGEARKYLNKVLQLNPESEAVKKKLEEIKGR